MAKFKYITVKPDLSVVVADKHNAKDPSIWHHPEFRVQYMSPDYEVTVMTNIPSAGKRGNGAFAVGKNDGWEFFGAEDVVMPIINGFLAGESPKLADLGQYLTGLGYKICSSSSSW